jgi:ElaB/YqjD/DUF883 family membrane-anchored ribosome-binding protein
MAERRDEPLRPADAGFGVTGTPRTADDDFGARSPASSGDYSARDKRPEEIHRDIRHTRAEMSETLDELGHRFSPHYIKEQVKDSVRSTAHDARRTMIDTIRDNPVPALIAGLSIGWLIARGGRSDHRDRDYYDDHDYYGNRYYGGRYSDRGYYGGSYDSRSYREGGGRGSERYYSGGEYYPYDERYDESGESLADRAGNMAHEARERVSDAADEAWDQAREAGYRVQETAEEAWRYGRRYGRRATNWLEDALEQNPLAAGAVALAAGALVGLAVPETRQEHRLMGETSDRLKDRVQDVAEEKFEQARAVAEKTLDEAKDHAEDLADEARDRAGDVAQTAQQESRRQGLTD